MPTTPAQPAALERQALRWHSNAVMHLMHPADGDRSMCHGDANTILQLWTFSDPVPMNKVAHHANLSRAAMTACIDRLETLGYVQRTPSGGDRRVTHVAISNKGRKLVGSIPGWPS